MHGDSSHLMEGEGLFTPYENAGTVLTVHAWGEEGCHLWLLVELLKLMSY
jgi:hypothetical protein